MLPFTKIYKCQKCGEIFKNSENISANCGVGAMQLYVTLKSIQEQQESKKQKATFSNKTETFDLDSVYGKIPLKVNRKNIENAQLDAIGDLSSQMHDQLQLDDKNIAKVKGRK